MATSINQRFIDDGQDNENTKNTNELIHEDQSILSNLLSKGTWNHPTITGAASSGLWRSLLQKSARVSNLGILSTGRANANVFFQANISGTTTKFYSTRPINLNSSGIVSYYSSGANPKYTDSINRYGVDQISNVSDHVETIDDELGSNYSTDSFGYHGGSTNYSPRNSSDNFTATNSPMGDKLYGPFYTSGLSSHVPSCYGAEKEDDSAIHNGTGTSLPTLWTSDAPNTPYFLLANPPPCKNDTTLSAVYVNGELLVATPSNEYTYQCNSSELPVSFQLVTSDPLATVSINGQSGAHDISGMLQLVPSINSFTILVTAQNGDTASYPLQINIPKSNNTNLSAVYVNGELLVATPSNEYNYQFNSSELPVSFQLVTSDPLATVSINDWSATHKISAALKLAPTTNSFTILVTAQNGDTASYPLQINILKSNNTNLSAVYVNGELLVATPSNEYNYQFNSSELPVSFQLVTSDPLATVSINDWSATHKISAALKLAPTTNSFTILVTAQNGDTASYPLQINILKSNNTNLSAVYVNGELLVATPSNEYNYQFNSSELPVSFQLITSDPLATVGVNGWVGTHDISATLQLVPHINSFTILVTAQNGVTASYPLQINTPKSNNTNLSAVYVNNELLVATPSNEYTYQFNSCELPVSFQLITSDPLATVSVNGWVGTHDISATLPLFPETNSFTILVTAQNGDTASYPLQINIPNNDTSLAILTVNGASIDLTAHEYTYLNSSVSSISIIAVPTDDRSSVQINGLEEPIMGSNTVTVVVTAQNGDTRSYPVKIYSPNDTTLSKVEVNGVLLETPSNEYFYKFNSTERRIRLSVMATDNFSSVQINGPRANLMPGSNTITIVVTAQNGDSKSYPLEIYTPLAAPTITTVRLSNNSANFSWAAIKEADTYNVYQSTDNCTYMLLKNITELSVILNTCIATPLYIQVAAVDTVKMVGRLSDASLLEFKRTPLSPTKLVSSSPASGTVKLDWAAPTGATDITSYTVYNDESIVLENIKSTTVTLTGLNNNTLYTFQVSARNSEGEGPKSSESKIVTSQLTSCISNVNTFSREIATLKHNAFEAILSARSAIHNARSLLDRDRQKLIMAALNTINTTGETLAISRSNTKEILATMKKINTLAAIDETKPVVVVIPNYLRSSKSGLYTATINLDTETGEVQGGTKVNVSPPSYADIIEHSKAAVIFELPNSTPGMDYTLTLWHGSDSITLLYDGTVLIDQDSTKYTANELLRIGTLTIPLIGLGW